MNKPDKFKPYKYEENDFRLVAKCINEWSSKSSLKDIWEKEDNLEYVKDKIKDYLHGVNDGSCFYCKRKIEISDAHIEHIVCKSKHPIYSFKLKNLTLACKDCNSNKSGKEVLTEKYTRSRFLYNNYPFKSKCYSIVHPYLDDYYQYVEFYNNIFYIAKGQSYKGIETIKACNLNRLKLLKMNAKKEMNELNQEQGFVKKYLLAQSAKEKELYKRKIETLTSLIEISNDSVINKFTQRVCQHESIISKLEEVSEKSVNNLLYFKDFAKEIDNINMFSKYINRKRKFQSSLSDKIKNNAVFQRKITNLDILTYLKTINKDEYKDEIKYLGDEAELDNLLNNLTDDILKKIEMILNNYKSINNTVEVINEIVRKKPLRESLGNIKHKQCVSVLQQLTKIAGEYPIYSDEMLALSKLVFIKNASFAVDENEAKELKDKLNTLITILQKEIS